MKMIACSHFEIAVYKIQYSYNGFYSNQNNNNYPSMSTNRVRNRAAIYAAYFYGYIVSDTLNTCKAYGGHLCYHEGEQ